MTVSIGTISEVPIFSSIFCLTHKLSLSLFISFFPLPSNLTDLFFPLADLILVE